MYQGFSSFSWRCRLAQGVAAGLLALPLGALAQQAFTRAGVSLMAGPGNNYPVVAMLGHGQPVDVMGCTQGYGWCDVVLPDGLRGWLYAPVLEYPYQGAPVPLPGYAAVIGVPIITFSIGSYWGRYYRDRPWYPEPRWWGGRPPPPVAGWRPPPPSRPSWQPRPGPPPPNFRPPKPPAWQQPRPDHHDVRPPRDPGMHPPRPGISTPPARPSNVGEGGRQWNNNSQGNRGNHGGPPPGRADHGGDHRAGPPQNNRGGGGGGDHGQGRGNGGGGGGGHGNRGGGGDHGKDR